MSKYLSFYLVAFVCCLGLHSCSESYLGIEQVVTDSNAPDKLTVGQVVAKSGALEIHFSLPKGNPNIAQVIATYTNKRGEEVEFKVSRYSSSILVEGLTGTNDVNIRLVCVDASGNVSDATSVVAAPLLSPVEHALRTLKVVPAFGGVKVEWENLTANPFIIHVLSTDTLQKGVGSLVEDPTKAIYTSDSLNTVTYVRQYPSIEQTFGFAVSDKWGNRTDTLITALVPYKEEEIDYSKINAVSFFNPTTFAGTRDYDTYAINKATGLRNDGNTHGNAHIPKTIFDGTRTGNQFYGYKFVKNYTDPDPVNRVVDHDFYMTYDLNMEVRLSRIKIFPRTALVYTYTRSSVKRFKIWGTNDSNNDRWTNFPGNWTLIGEYVGREPGNLGSLTPEEIEFFNFNQEYSISEGNINPEGRPDETFRYMRIQLMESYNPNEAFYTINEFQMFGDVQQYY